LWLDGGGGKPKEWTRVVLREPGGGIVCIHACHAKMQRAFPIWRCHLSPASLISHDAIPASHKTHSLPPLTCWGGCSLFLALALHTGRKATNEREREGGGSPWLRDLLSPGNGLQIAAVVAEKSKKKAAWKEKKAATGGNIWADSIQHATQDCRFNTHRHRSSGRTLPTTSFAAIPRGPDLSHF
jgi:hypothetical protein